MAARYSAAEVADTIGHLRDCSPSSSSCNSALEEEEPVLEGLTKVRNPSCSSGLVKKNGLSVKSRAK